jgi:ATP adenylyltransferase
MDYLWTPWRYRYVAEAAKDQRCIFCEALAMNDDERGLILLRGKKNFLILNRFPYTTGHTMIVPYAHRGELADYDGETLTEMMELAQRLERALGACYRAQGFNLGMNLGRSAGAGVADHIHLHVVPRWAGDTNFMTTISETRLEPEDLATTYRKLRPALEQLS